MYFNDGFNSKVFWSANYKVLIVKNIVSIRALIGLLFYRLFVTPC